MRFGPFIVPYSRQVALEQRWPPACVHKALFPAQSERDLPPVQPGGARFDRFDVGDAVGHQVFARVADARAAHR